MPPFGLVRARCIILELIRDEERSGMSANGVSVVLVEASMLKERAAGLATTIVGGPEQFVLFLVAGVHLLRRLCEQFKGYAEALVQVPQGVGRVSVLASEIQTRGTSRIGVLIGYRKT
jgi:hypothetical protein